MDVTPVGGTMSTGRESLQSDRRFMLDRLLLARISSGIGALALVIMALIVLLQRDITGLALLSTVIGIAGIALWTVLAPDDFRTLISGRQARYGGNSIFTSILVIGIVAIVYTLTATSGLAADLTSVSYYSLKPDVQQLVKNLEY